MGVITDVKQFVNGMDKDTDIRYLPNGKYISARNIKINNPLTGRIGTPTNMPGIKGLSVSPYLTSAETIIYTLTDSQNNCIYVFAHSATNLHRILRYTPTSNMWEYVVVSSALNFSVDHPIRSADIIEGTLFWTDFYNPPQNYMVGFDYFTAMGYAAYSPSTTYASGNTISYNGVLYSSASSGNIGNYPSGLYTSNTYWNVVENQGYDDSYFSIATVVPRQKPSVSVGTDAGFVGNFISGRFIQLKFRFVFKNGQRSVFSPISDLVYSNNDYSSPATLAASGGYVNNFIAVVIPNSGANRLVDKIEIASRDGNNGDFNLVETITVSSSFFTSGYTYNFYNNGVYIPIPVSESIQIYDDVPILTRALRYAENRLMFGGTINGYDKIVADYAATRILRTRSTTAPVTLTGNSTVDQTWLTDSDGSTLQAAATAAGYTVLGAGDVIRVQGYYTGEAYSGVTIQFGDISVTVEYGWTWQDVVTAILAQTVTVVDNMTSPGYPEEYEETLLGDVTAYENDLDPADPNYGREVHFYNDSFIFYFTVGGGEIESTFKSGSYYNIGLQYHDKYGRTNGVIFNDVAKIYIPTLAERNLTATSLTNAGGASILVTINHTPPSWASYYSVVWSNAYKESLALTISATDAKAGVLSGSARIPLTSITNSVTTYKTNLAYSWEKGDRIRFITYDASAGSAAGLTEWANKPYDAEIVTSYANYVDSPADGVPSIEFYLPNGLTVNQIKYSMVEIYRPSYSKTAEQSLFNEGVLFPITNGVHEGDIDQTISGTASGINYTGLYVNGTVRYITLAISALSSAIKVGDSVTFTGGATGTYTVATVTYNENRTVTVSFTGAAWTNNPAATGTISYSMTNKPAIVYLTDGDAYIRERTLLFGSPYDVMVESFNLSDFINDSEQYSLGRQTAIINQARSDNYASIFYSEVFIPNTDINGLNRVYPDVNYEEYEKLFGSILYLDNEGDSMTVFQEDKVSRVMIGRSVTYDSQGNANYMGTVSSVLSQQIPYLGNYGLQQPWSFQVDGIRKYWVDSSRGAVLRLSLSGIEEISKYGMIGYFKDECRNAVEQASVDQHVAGLFDASSGEYIVSFANDDEVAVFSENNNAWVSHLDTPFLCGCHLDNRTFYASGSDFNEINRVDVPYNTIQYEDGDVDYLESSVEFVCNIAASNLKTFLSMGIDGNYPWDVDVRIVPISGFYGQETNMISSDFVMLETEYQAPILRDVTTPNCINPVINGYPLKGREAIFTMTLPEDNHTEECYVKSIKIIASNG